MPAPILDPARRHFLRHGGLASWDPTVGPSAANPT